MDRADVDRQLVQVTSLGEPIRRALYHYVAGQGTAVGRDEAAAAVGIGRPLAVYHLDKLVADGLLAARYERRGNRRGPGAGRPAKLYVRSGRQVELSLPPRDYELAARLLARGVEADRSGAARRGLLEAARAAGAELAAQVAAGPVGAPTGSGAPTGPRGPDRAGALREVLTRQGYEPYEDGGEDGRPRVRLRNCPFDRLAGEHQELVCQANLALLEGLVERLGGPAPRPVLAPRPGECCVAFEPAEPEQAAGPGRRRLSSGRGTAAP